MSSEAILETTPASPRGIRWGLLAVLGGAGAMLALLLGGMLLIPRYRAANPAMELQRSDADRVAIDDLYLDLTLVTPAFLKTRSLERYLGERDPASMLPVLVGVNAHTGSIEHMHHLDGELFVVGPDGARYPALSEPIVLTQHHNAYMVLFPSRDNHGVPFLDESQGAVRVEAVGMGGVDVRRFEWALPLDEQTRQGLVPALMLAVALLSALLVVLSPCAIELTLYYSAIVSCTISEGEREAIAAGGLRAAALGRRRVLVNLASFVVGFTLLYSVAGATVGLIGQGVRQPMGEYAEIIPIAGGSLILFFAMRVLGLDRILAGLLSRLSALGPDLGIAARWRSATGRARGVLASLRLRGQSRGSERGAMRASDSFLVGLGLSASCVSCMGGAVLYPLLVYAGITSWFSGFITLGLYSLGIALPMVAIALGFMRIRLSLAGRLGFNRALRYASGTLLAGIGVLIVSGNESVITDVAFGILGGAARWFG